MGDEQAWRVLSSSHVLKNRWISLRADDCATADGVRIAPYYVLEYPDWVQIVALNEKDEVLLIEQYRHGAAAMSLEIPAGAIEPSDLDVLAAAKRELLEETGCTGGPPQLISTSSPNPASHANRMHTVLFRDVRCVQAPLEDPTERIESRWVPIATAFELSRSGRIMAATQVAALLLAFSHLGVLGLDDTVLAD